MLRRIGDFCYLQPVVNNRIRETVGDASVRYRKFL